ncbi:MAG: hypothetical protein ACKO7W_04870 [Elainella sp.]
MTEFDSTGQTSNLPVPYCFCTLAFGAAYRQAAKALAAQAEPFGIQVFVATDDPADFRDSSNVVAGKVRRTSILYAYNDKRFALAMALEQFECAVLVDADSVISGNLPAQLQVMPGMTASVKYTSLETDLQTYHSRSLPAFTALAKRLQIQLSETAWVCENLIIIRRDQGRELEFLRAWAFADRWLGVRHVFQGDAAFIGMAAKAADWTVQNDHPAFQQLRQAIVNQGRNTLKPTQRPPFMMWTKRIGFYRRWLLSGLHTLSAPSQYWF